MAVSIRQMGEICQLTDLLDTVFYSLLLKKTCSQTRELLPRTRKFIQDNTSLGLNAELVDYADQSLSEEAGGGN